MIRPVRIQLSRRKGFDLQALSLATNGLPAVNVARPTRWGNPFRVGGVTVFGRFTQTANFVVERYREWIASDDWHDAAERRSAIHELRGKNLACWCAPGAPCHADVLLDLANRAEAAQ